MVGSQSIHPQPLPSAQLDILLEIQKGQELSDNYELLEFRHGRTQGIIQLPFAKPLYYASQQAHGVIPPPPLNE